MALDTKLHKKSSSQSRSGPDLDADRFFWSLPIEPRVPGRLESTLCQGHNGQVYLVYYEPAERIEGRRNHPIKIRVSDDRGRTWSEPRTLVDTSGKPVCGAHITMMRLKSGKLGLVYASHEVPEIRVGRDGGTEFRVSGDEGRTWSEPVVVEPRFGFVCSGHAIVHSSGRIILPMLRWLSPDPTGESESFIAPAFTYTWMCVSDDEGKTWQKSLSELFIGHYRTNYDFDESTPIELTDGRLLLHARTQLGRIYRSFSKDEGISWSFPEPLPFAAGNTPCSMRRIPATGDILLIWNQISRQEILSGYHRHRLSVAISRDEGQTWQNFKNLESLDDTTVVTPPPMNRLEVLEMWEDYGYYQPANTKRYHRAPGVLRICYPDATILGDEAIIVYDWGAGVLGDKLGTKLRAVPISWFYEAADTPE